MSAEAIPGALRLEPNELGSFVPLLKKLYEFEASRVSGPGSPRRKISEILWSRDELIEKAHLGSDETKILPKLLKVMNDRRAIMEVKFENPKQPVRYVSRVAETVRLLGHGYEYWHKGRP